MGIRNCNIKNNIFKFVLLAQTQHRQNNAKLADIVLFYLFSTQMYNALICKAISSLVQLQKMILVVLGSHQLSIKTSALCKSTGFFVANCGQLFLSLFTPTISRPISSQKGLVCMPFLLVLRSPANLEINI